MLHDAVLLFPEVDSDPEPAAVNVVVDAAIAARAEEVRRLGRQAEKSQADVTA